MGLGIKNSLQLKAALIAEFTKHLKISKKTTRFLRHRFLKISKILWVVVGRQVQWCCAVMSSDVTHKTKSDAIKKIWNA